MSAEKMQLLGSFSDHEPVEMMDDDDSSNDSDIEDTKSDHSGTKTKLVGSNGLNNIYNHNNNNNNNNTEILNSNGTNKLLDEFADADKLAQYPEELAEEDEERKRFQIELEFVQSLANPNYLNFLAQRGYFRNQTFLNYLKYLMYWTEPEYVKYIMYPQCLSLLELLQHEQFLKEIVNAQCSKYIDEQLLLIWLHYKKRRDWIHIDPVKVPEGNEKLFQKTENLIIKNNEKILEDSPNIESNNVHSFSAEAFLANEKL